MGELFSIASTIFRIVSTVEVFLSVVSAVAAVCVVVTVRRALRKHK